MYEPPPGLTIRSPSVTTFMSTHFGGMPGMSLPYFGGNGRICSLTSTTTRSETKLVDPIAGAMMTNETARTGSSSSRDWSGRYIQRPILLWTGDARTSG